MIILLALLMIGGVATYDMNDWKYVGKHECERIGLLDPEKARVYPLKVDGFKPYILFKQQNKDGSYSVACTNK